MRREAWVNKKRDDERGAVLYILAIFLIIFIAVAALAVDLAALGNRGQDLQNTSDAAALAAIVEYQEQLLAGASAVDAEAAAEALALEIVAQNGLDLSSGNILVEVTFSADGSEATVSITDTNPDSFLPTDILGETIKPGDPQVGREATATFLACENECAVVVEIPQPFGAVDARGNGDGYKPIEVGTGLYALNHNTGTQAIVCVDRVTQAPCWVDAAGDPEVFRTAYAPAVGYNDRNPEMPQTGVINGRIYWSATDASNGLRLFCWDTAIDSPCNSAHTLDSSLLRIDEDDSPLTNDKDENRGGGTIAFGEKIFVFSDNHRIHCFDPSFGGICNGYVNGGNPTALDVVPANDPNDGNHGSSIDRIVDEDTGFIYSVLHIPNAQTVPDCSGLPLADPAGRRVIVVNDITGRFLAADPSGFVYATENGSTAEAWWDVENEGGDTLTFQSAESGRYLDTSPFATTSADIEPDLSSEWNAIIDGDAYFIVDGQFIRGGLQNPEDDLDNIIEDGPPPAVQPTSRWNFYPWECGDPGTLGVATPDWFESGTWLHCYDTGVRSGVPQPCPNFTVTGVGDDSAGTRSPIHVDGSRFSGRLWFHRTSTTAVKQGVCSSGYGDVFTPSAIEINCVDMTGAFSQSLTDDMTPVRDQIRGWTGTRPGAWGDPHWNETTNRLFYPTEHNTSRIICYDFDTGPCNSLTGSVPPNSSGLTATEDYGFISDGDCIFALGHNAFFWAFKASNTLEDCEPQPLPTTIERCPCGDGETFRWGELDFSEVDLSLFDVFAVRVVENIGDASQPIFPADGSFSSIKPGGASPLIPLDDLAIPEDATSVNVEILIEGAGGINIADLGDFQIRFSQRPRLVN